MTPYSQEIFMQSVQWSEESIVIIEVMAYWIICHHFYKYAQCVSCTTTKEACSWFESCNAIRHHLTFKALSKKIANRKSKKLRGKEIPLVKMIWREPNNESVMWELNEKIKIAYM